MPTQTRWAGTATIGPSAQGEPDGTSETVTIAAENDTDVSAEGFAFALPTGAVPVAATVALICRSVGTPVLSTSGLMVGGVTAPGMSVPVSGSLGTITSQVSIRSLSAADVNDSAFGMGGVVANAHATLSSDLYVDAQGIVCDFDVAGFRGRQRAFARGR